MAGFIPNVRVDHENRSSHGCFHADIATGPAGDGGPVYVAIENDSFAGIIVVRSDICFQKSSDGGRSWLAEDRLVRRGMMFACYPDITVDRDGVIYIVYTERPSGLTGHFYCVRSTDHGETWSDPVQVDDNQTAVGAGWARVSVDGAGRLFCAWNESRTGRMRIWSSVSTDRGETWLPSVRVDDDTVPGDCYHADVTVQPGSNRYLVTASEPYWVQPGYINSNAVFHVSTDLGQTWTAGFTLDTFSGYCGQPHVVASPGRITCDYTGDSDGNQSVTEARTSTDGGLTWSPPVAVTNLDTLYNSYVNGGKLAVDIAGGVHVCLMVCDMLQWDYDTYYAYSSDGGLIWSARERVNDVTADIQVDPNIAVDSAGYAYLIWQDGRNNRNEIWFSTNNGAAVRESPPVAVGPVLRCIPSIFRVRTQILAAASAAQVFDADGRLVRVLSPSDPSVAGRRSLTWDGRGSAGRRCPAGVYVVRCGNAACRVVYRP